MADQGIVAKAMELAAAAVNEGTRIIQDVRTSFEVLA
jgi:hypothetical protein